MSKLDQQAVNQNQDVNNLNNSSDNISEKEKQKDVQNSTHPNYPGSITNDAVEAAVMRYVGGDYNQWSSEIFNDDLTSVTDPSGTSKSKILKSGDSIELNKQQKLRKHEDDDETLELKKKRKLDDGSGVPKATSLVDPELAQLDNTTNEHDQLVQAAINDVKVFARLSEFEHDYILSQQNSKSVANQDGQSQQQDLSQLSNMQNTEVATLVAQAATTAGAFVVGRPQGKMFSKEEHEAIDKFVYAYCQIHKMTRQDICKRIWSNNRTKDSFWDSLQKVLPHRSRASVYKHVRRAYHIFAVRGKWRPEEDAQLGELAREKEGQWKAIGEIMGRMPEDCRDRWRNYVKCGANRVSNKWAEEEEDKLKEIIHEIFRNNPQNPVINWTIVSEKMGGSRSRIQCRYKWNKLLKREATHRALQMDQDDQVWLITRLRELQFEDESQVEWDALASLHPKNFWTGSDFKVSFEKMRSSIKDYKNKKMDEICAIIVNNIYGNRRQGSSNMFDQMNHLVEADSKKIKKDGDKKKDVDLASAAVAAVTADSGYFI